MSFFIDRLLGRTRRGSQASKWLFIIGGFLLCTTCSLTVFGLPYGVMRSWEVAALPRPQPAELRHVAPGTALLMTAQLPAITATDESALALFYVEQRYQNRPTRTSSDNSPTNNHTRWQIETPPPAQIALRLTDGRTLTVQLPPKPVFLRAQTIDQPPADNRERRYVGYLPGQTLTVEGTWEGDNRLTARTLYAGNIEGFLAYQTNLPWFILIVSVTCGGLGLLVLGLGILFKIVGR